MSLAKRELRSLDHLRIAIDWKQQIRDVAVFAGMGLLLAVLNPFGSVTEVPLATGILYWVSLVLWGGLLGKGLAWLLGKLAPNLPAWAFFGALSVLMTAVVYPAVALEQAFVMHQPIPLGRTVEFVFYVWLITLVSSTGIELGFRAFGKRSGIFDHTAGPLPTGPPPVAPPAAAPMTTPGAPPFLDRLPVRLRSSTIYAVQSEDHYLRVHTSGGEELILMRIADAIRELATLDGLQTHRSWWVARDGLADAARANGKLVLKLKSGAEAPVSRTYLRAVKDKGWA